MSVVGWILTAVIAIPLLALAAAIIRFNQKRLHIVRCAASASPEKLERIYAQIDRLGTEAATGCVLARTNGRADAPSNAIPLPAGLEAFPWGGRTVAIEAGSDVTFRFTETPAAAPSLLGRIYRPVRVPRSKAKASAKLRNTFSPERYLAGNQPLRDALDDVCPGHAGALLGYLLCVGRESYEFDPIDQARIGTSPAWVQDAAFPSCEACRRRMSLILQLPGTLISPKAFHRGTFYFFGCPQHPEQTRSLGQFT